jgi:hypothetical protein
MEILSPQLDLDVFFACLGAAPRVALMLDGDGNLTPFRLSPREAIPYPAVPGVLHRIMTLGRTRLVVVTI